MITGGLELAREAAEVHGLPAPTEYLGSGALGDAWLTEDPTWVLKLTTDPVEYEQWRDVAAGALKPEARPYAHLVVKVLGAVVARVDDNAEDELWAIWKERVVPWDPYQENFGSPSLRGNGIWDDKATNVGWRVTDEGSRWLVGFDVYLPGY